MAADELGAVLTNGPLKISTSVTSVGKEMDSEKKEHPQQPETPEREEDTVEIHTTAEVEPEKHIVEHPHDTEDAELFPGSHVDLTVS